MTNLTTKYILIDSRYKTYGSNSNFKIYLNKPITVNSYISINYLFLPRMGYLINSNNEYFEIEFITSSINNNNNNLELNNNNNNINNIVSIRFTHQNYTPATLCDYINTYIGNYYNFICSYNQFTFKIEFRCDIPFIIHLEKTSFHKLINLERKYYFSSQDTISNVFLTNTINFNNPYYFNLNLANISNDVMMGSSNSKQVNFIIPLLSNNFGEIIQYKPLETSNFKMVVDNKLITYLDIVLTDDENNIFENNNSNWFMILEYDTFDN